MRKPGERAKTDPNQEAFQAAWQLVCGNPIFRAVVADPSGVGTGLDAQWVEDLELTRSRAYGRINSRGAILVNKHARAQLPEWIWILEHLVLHAAFEHLEPSRVPDSFQNAANCLVVARFQAALRNGTPPHAVPVSFPGSDESQLAAHWRDSGIPEEYAAIGVGGSGPDVVYVPPKAERQSAKAIVRQKSVSGPKPYTWSERFAIGLAGAATIAVESAGTPRAEVVARSKSSQAWETSRRWFVSSYPLLAGLAAGFTIVADLDLARDWQITIAAVNPQAAEIYVNPMYVLSDEERRFVIAHEMLHAALRHGDRVGPRDPYLWNIAADYVINDWLIEMGVGELPEGCLYDPKLHGMSAEAVYDLIAKDLRRMRRLSTLRGRGLGDILDPAFTGKNHAHRGTELDEYYRRALISGLAYHHSNGRGFLPAGLVAEIRVLDQPPIPWDAQLAKWFDEYVPAPEKRRSYARPSRRQASTPDIPRPGWYLPEEAARQCTFGVVLDTSGSMDSRLLGKALGAIASYAMAREVPAARVVFCDAVAYDAGYLKVEEIAGRVRVKGRGGTKLQPGVSLLERAEDFPSTGPILVITDGYCDLLRIRRDHAFLMPAGAKLPFRPKGPVFMVK